MAQSSSVVWSKVPGATEALNSSTVLLDGCRIEAELGRQFADGRRFDRREDRRHEQVDRFGVDDRIGDLPRLLRDQAAPDGVALGPGVLALVVEAFALAVDHDAEDHAVEPRGDTAVEARRPRVDGDRVALRRIADIADAGVEQHAQHVATVIGRAADEEIVGGLAPVLLEPFDIGLEAAGGGDQRLAADRLRLAVERDHRRHEVAVGDVERGHRRVVEHGDAERLRRAGRAN